MDKTVVSCAGVRWSGTPNVNISLTRPSFLKFPFCGLHARPRGVQGLSKHHNMLLDLKLGHGSWAIHQIPCACYAWTCVLENTFEPRVVTPNQACYKPLHNSTYWTVLGFLTSAISSYIQINLQQARTLKRLVSLYLMA